MDFLSIIILGFVQGIAEFLPISSSAHLIIFRDLFGIGQGMDAHLALTFDLALHFGTLLAIGIYFFKDYENNTENEKAKAFINSIKESAKPIKEKFKYIEIYFYNDGRLFHDNKYYAHDILEQDADKVAKEIIELYNYYLIRL